MDAISANVRTVCMHSLKKTSVYLGFLDPLLMLSLPDEALCRQAFRTVDVYVVVSNPFILPLSWKNGISKLVVVGQQQDAPNTQALDDSCTAHVPRTQV